MKLSDVEPWKVFCNGQLNDILSDADSNDITEVTFLYPIMTTVIGNPPHLFIAVKNRSEPKYVGVIDDEKPFDPCQYLAQHFPGVSFFAPDKQGNGYVALVECRPIPDRGGPDTEIREAFESLTSVPYRTDATPHPMFQDQQADESFLAGPSPTPTEADDDDDGDLQINESDLDDIAAPRRANLDAFDPSDDKFDEYS